MSQIVVDFFGSPGGSVPMQLLWLGQVTLSILCFKTLVTIVLEIIRGLLK